MNVDQHNGLSVLHVEDNVGDVRLIAEAFKETGRSHRVAVVCDGAEALDYLYRRGRYAKAPHPDLVLLDLNLPKKSGLEVLDQIKADSKLKHIPVIVFTSSAAPFDINRAYDFHANCYVTKPAELNDLFRVISLIERLWLEAAKLPRRIE
jgi:CheY-like chemotaxis protein